jgi:fatty acid desaturase
MGEPVSDHRTLVASLGREQRAALLCRSDRLGAMQLAAHLGALAATGAAIALGVPFWPLLLVPHGILIIFLFTALHECSHRTAFRTEWINRVVAGVAGFLVLVPPEWFRCFHAAHHRFTHDPARDPELAVPEPRTRWEYAWRLTGLPLWRASLRTLLINAAGGCRDGYLPAGSRAAVTREARLMLAGYALLAAGSLALRSDLLLWLWVVPALLGQPFLRAYLMAEHGRCPPVADMLANSRTTFTTALVRRLAWNMPYHAEHHAYPAVPFHALPRFHELAKAHLKTTERGYARFHRRFATTLATRLPGSRPAASASIGRGLLRR